MKSLITVGILTLTLAACSPAQEASTTPLSPTAADTPSNNPSMKEATMPTQNIIEIAAGNPDFSTLVTAVTEAGLVETLSGTGPFTVFAPTNEAFEKLPADTLESVLKDKEQLTAILTYHVVPGKVMAADVAGLTTATTVQGGDLAIDTSNGVMVNNATVVATDIEATNGVIHVIDTVLLPQ